MNLTGFRDLHFHKKRKNQIGLHKNFNVIFPNEQVLEISSSSLYSIGSDLSAMNLKKQTKKGLTTVESAFQSSRIYSTPQGEIGPFPEYLFLTGKECKKIVKEKSLGYHSYRYNFDGMDFFAPDYHISLFYDYLYLNALCEDENHNVAKLLLESGYTAFTDLATLSLNSQARSAAIFISLARCGRIDEIKTYDSFLKLFRTTTDGKAIDMKSYERVQLINNKGVVNLFTPVVCNTFRRAQVETYYSKTCSCLTNKKDSNNYIDKV